MHSFAKTIEIDTKAAKDQICKKMAGSKTGVRGTLTEQQIKDGGDKYCGCFGVKEGAGAGAAEACLRVTGGNGELEGAQRNNGVKWSDAGGELRDANRVVDGKTAKVIADNIKDLDDKDEKSKVAQAFAKTIEGAEVVEVKAVTSTSVIVNACYDLINDSIGVVPYACVGIGGNFVIDYTITTVATVV